MINCPRVSVVMAAYNTERWIAAAIDSVLAQTFADFELLIVDDGSTDGTPGIISEHSRRDPRIRILRPSRVGVVEARNMAIREARGEYIAIMDSDDLSMPDRFEKEVTLLDTNLDILAVTAGMAMIHGQLTVPNDLTGLKTLIPSDGPVGNLSGFDIRYLPTPHPPAMFRREALLKVGLYRPHFTHAEDADLFLRMEELGSVHRMPDILCLYRKHLENTSIQFPYVQIESTVLALLSARRRRRGELDFMGSSARAFWRLFRLGLRPAEIVHTLALTGIRCARKAPKQRKARRRRSTALTSPAGSEGRTTEAGAG